MAGDWGNDGEEEGGEGEKTQLGVVANIQNPWRTGHRKQN